MANLLVGCFVFSALLAACSAGRVPSALPVSYASNVLLEGSPRATSWDCEGPGLQCTDCTTLTMCIQASSGFTTVLVQNCALKGLFCSHSERACSEKSSYCSKQEEFQCSDEGVFPDPYHCNVYHTCERLVDDSDDSDDADASDDGTRRVDDTTRFEDDEKICPSGTAFNIKTLLCDLKDSHESCTGTPVPECDKDGKFSTGALPNNPSFYYVCVGGVHQLYKCLNEGEVYNEQLFGCSAPLSTTEQPTTAEPITQNPLCPNTGYNYDPEKCSSYYFCGDPANPSHRSCTVGKYFNRSKGKCVLGSCPY